MALALLGIFGNGENDLRAIGRLVFGIFALWGVSFLGFVLIYYSQGSVAFANVSQGMSPAMRFQIEENLNLHRPLLDQYQTWLFQVLRGDFSTSLMSGESVSSIIAERIPYTLILGGSAFVLLIFFSIILAFLSLWSSSLDRCIAFLGMGFVSLPTFSLGLLLILFLSVKWSVFPSSGASDIGMEDQISNRLLHLALPVMTLVISHLGIFTQFVRTTLIDALNQEFIQFGLARGLSLFYIYMHWVLKYALSPIVAYFSASFVSFMMGTYVVEGVFSYGGIGQTLINGLIFKDYPLVLAILLMSFASVLVVNFLADCLCAKLNQGRV
ncbi:ABC transporter permease [Helicobacter kayseriensis]|uniref:ABC transporter permease n=1 Tax=Helicobacter kayseriensis TaxID=2905877 RepID=UPI001E31A1AE|nr:ABC transporter permease [Helicobacter kayseriensis]MCE3047733.1 ABC transporter permease [Helicobacter kayseriensis]MCE3049116.1 ABC transporter permease [Helicobacter kayseriensis]